MDILDSRGMLRMEDMGFYLVITFWSELLLRMSTRSGPPNHKHGCDCVRYSPIYIYAHVRTTHTVRIHVYVYLFIVTAPSYSGCWSLLMSGSQI